MNTVNTIQQPAINESISVIDALWNLISAQPKKYSGLCIQF